MSGLLDGLRVADLSIVTAGAGATQVLADFGADVIKIEGIDHPDLFRRWHGETGDDDLASPPFRTVNRSKRGLAVDLKSAAGLEAAQRLVASSDVVVENFRRSVVERLGLGFDDLTAIRPDLVLVSLSSQGATGPNAGYTSFGSTLDALGGLASITGYDRDTPLWSSSKVNYPDQVVSLLAPALVLAGVLAARRSGRGRWIDLSQREVVTSLLGEWVLMRSRGAPDPGPTGNSGPGTLDWCTPCKGDDEWVALSLASEQDHARCARVVGRRPPNADDADIDVGLRDAVAHWSRQRTKHEAFRTLQEAGVAAAPVARGIELHNDPYFTAMEWFQTVPLAGGGVERQRGWPVRFRAGGPHHVSRRAPHVGEHTSEVLRELGYDDHGIARLIADGAVGQYPS